MQKREFKDQVYTILAQLVKAMANAHRLEIIDLLSQGERSVEEIANETHMSVANASQHLQMLKQSNLLQIRREGKFIYYRLANTNVLRLWKDLRAIGMDSFAEIGRLVKDYRGAKNSLDAVNLEELVTRMESRNVVLLDVRPEQEFEAGHIPKAINIPVDQLATRLQELSKSKQYIAYCRGIFCVFADEAVQLLSAKGYKARRLEEGYPDWKLKFAAKDIL
ncbi:MAG TPA: metalloregulator ArsR/SmtB family transcription factor [Chitinophaga sp.]|uniref:ArsR/SmtB family transcription factor n=1 Tax=Chitinophaga sp. TaxID=1869181 RepID=UPI002C38E867|nr:metalloregulator ArsR/SmtB family transcription factor [Chitinophaga sp.]HVI43545.1 metalloregulator ArsR/SmtB family transcription factor [Chitinophaga sp.]